MIKQFKDVVNIWPGNKDDVLNGMIIAVSGLMESMTKECLENMLIH
jgi:hypothetical protein